MQCTTAVGRQGPTAIPPSRHGDPTRQHSAHSYTPASTWHSIAVSCWPPFAPDAGFAPCTVTARAGLPWQPTRAAAALSWTRAWLQVLQLPVQGQSHAMRHGSGPCWARVSLSLLSQLGGDDLPPAAGREARLPNQQGVLCFNQDVGSFQRAAGAFRGGSLGGHFQSCRCGTSALRCSAGAEQCECLPHDSDGGQHLLCWVVQLAGRGRAQTSSECAHHILRVTSIMPAECTNAAAASEDTHTGPQSPEGQSIKRLTGAAAQPAATQACP